MKTKLLITLTALLLAAFQAEAQSIAVAGDTGNGSIKVSVLNGNTLTVSSYLKDLAFDSAGPWVLACSNDSATTKLQCFFPAFPLTASMT